MRMGREARELENFSHFPGLQAAAALRPRFL